MVVVKRGEQFCMCGRGQKTYLAVTSGTDIDMEADIDMDIEWPTNLRSMPKYGSNVSSSAADDDL